MPIEGEAGVGYRLQKGFELRPMTFTVDELEALVLGARLVETWADPELGNAVCSAMSKIGGVLPEPLQTSMLRTALFGPPHLRGRGPRALGPLRRALTSDPWVRLEYVDQSGAPTVRTVAPLGLYFWSRQWLLASYCFLRHDYRSFRVHRIAGLTSVDVDAELRRVLLRH